MLDAWCLSQVNRQEPGECVSDSSSDEETPSPSIDIETSKRAPPPPPVVEQQMARVESVKEMQLAKKRTCSEIAADTAAQKRQVQFHRFLERRSVSRGREAKKEVCALSAERASQLFETHGISNKGDRI